MSVILFWGSMRKTNYVQGLSFFRVLDSCLVGFLRRVISPVARPLPRQDKAREKEKEIAMPCIPLPLVVER
jgi:hypothetical protein